MKNRRRIIGIVLAVLMVVPLLTFGISAEAAKEAAKEKVLYSEDFESYKVPPTFKNYAGTSGITQKIVNRGEGKAIELTDTNNYTKDIVIVPADKMSGVKKYSVEYIYKGLANANTGILVASTSTAHVDWQDGQDAIYVNWNARFGYNGTEGRNFVEPADTVLLNKEALIKYEIDSTTGECKCYKDGEVFQIWSGLQKRVTDIRYINYWSGNGSSCILDDIKVVDMETGKVIYEENFDSYNDKSADIYKSTATADGGGQMYQTVMEENGNKSLRLTNDKYKKYPLMVSADKLQGVTRYTVEYDVTALNNFNFGIRVGKYDDATRNGDWLYTDWNAKFNSRSFKGNEGRTVEVTGDYFDGTPRASAAPGATLLLNKKAHIAYDIDAVKGIANCYLDGRLVGTVKGITNEVSGVYWFADEPGSAVVDNVKVTAGKAWIENVGYQTSAVKDGKYSVRFIGAFNDDIAGTKEVGFTVKAIYGETVKTFEYKTTKVYSSILADGKPVTAASLEADCLFALTIKNIPTDIGNVTFEYTPHFVAADGTVYNGATSVQTVTVK